MSVVTVTAGDVIAYTGSRTPSTARLYANKQFIDSTAVIVAQGTKLRPLFYQSFSASQVGSAIRIASGTVYSTTDSSDPAATYTLVIYDTNGREMLTVFTNLRVPPTSPTTWSALAANSDTVAVPLDERFYNATQIDTLFDEYGDTAAPLASEGTHGKVRLSAPATTLSDPVALGANDTSSITAAVSKASTTVEGKTKISFAPAVANTPIAVSDNDPIIVAARQIVYLSTYGHTQSGLDTAISAIGSTQVDLLVTSSVTISSNTNAPSNINIILFGNGGFSVNSGITLTIGCMAPVAARQIFSGAGVVAFAKNATGGVFKAEWWAGLANAGEIAANVLTGWTTSLTNNVGGMLQFGAGDWFFTNFTPPSGTLVKGVGSLAGNSGGTTLKLFTTGGTNPVIRIGGNIRDVKFEDLTVDSNGSTTAAAILCQGAGPNSTLIPRFKNVTIKHSGTGSIGLHIDSTASSWEVFQSLAGVHFNSGTNGKAISCDSPNVGLHLTEMCSFYCAAGAVSLHWTAIGWVKIDFLDARGPGYAAPTSASDRTVTATVAAGANATVTLSAGTFTINDLGQKYTQGAVDSVIIDILSSTTATILSGGAGEGSGTGTIYRFTQNTSMPKAVLWAEGQFSNIEINGGADEGYQYFFINDHSDLNGVLNLNGVTVQSQIKLNQSCTLVRKGCNIYSQGIADGAAAGAQIFDFGNVEKKTSVLAKTTGGGDVDLVNTYPWGVHSGTSYFKAQFNNRIGDSTLVQRSNAPQNIFYGPEHAGNPQSTVPIYGAGSVSGVDKVHYRFGLQDPLTKAWTNYYDLDRDHTTGFATLIGTDPHQYRGFDAQMLIRGKTFRSNVISPSQITANQNDYAITNTGVIRVTTDAERTVTGIVMSDYLQQDGEMFEIWNVGSFNIVFAHQHSSSTAAYRIISATGGNITLPPNCGMRMIYDGTTSRWRAWPLGVLRSGSLTIGYSGGAGATVTQVTSRTTGVTINAPTGAITLVSAAGSTTPASFTVTNSFVQATDTPLVVQKSGTDEYEIDVTNVAAGSFKITCKTNGGTTTEQPVFSFSLIAGVTS